MLKAVVLLATVACATAYVVDSSNVQAAIKFQQYMADFGKQYPTPGATDAAFENFQATLTRLAEYEARGHKNTFGLTKFSDLSRAEFRSQYLMQKGSIDIKMLASKFKVAEPIPNVGGGADPATYDWRTQKAVTPVKDQGQCGSCWAFSTTENFESMWFLGGNTIPTLGPQQIVDCDPQSQGCSGGWTYWAMEYLMTAGGQESEADYPYTAYDGTCAFDKSKIVARISNYTFATTPCEQGSCPVQDTTLRHALATIGPLSICVNAEIWSDWSGPTPLPASECPGDADELDHCVQLVGYNWSSNYWIVRNSWNTDWGQQGYIYLQTNQNTCGLGDVVTFANIAKSEARHPHHRKH